MVIQWTETALSDLHGIYDYIKEFSTLMSVFR